MEHVKVWDPLVRIFHWSLATLFLANALFTDPESDLHHWVGYGVMGLIIVRLVWGFIGTEYARFSSFLPNMEQAKSQLVDIATGRAKIHLGHTPLGALMIYNLLGSLLVVVISGYMMTTDYFWGEEWVEEVHEIFVSWVEVSVVLHIIAVIYESRRTNVNLPRSMVTGMKKIPINNEDKDDC